MAPCIPASSLPPADLNAFDDVLRYMQILLNHKQIKYNTGQKCMPDGSVSFNAVNLLIKYDLKIYIVT